MTAKDKIYTEGRSAHELGEVYGENPYDVYLQHPQHELWCDGWHDAHCAHLEEMMNE